MTSLALAVCLLLTAAADDVRQELSLAGAWEYQLVPELGTPPTDGEWKSCAVPGYLSGTDYQRAWLRRSFAVPTSVRGQRLKLHFGGVKYHKPHLSERSARGRLLWRLRAVRGRRDRGSPLGRPQRLGRRLP